MVLKNKVLIRKPSDDEQREGKIVTSDYLVSAVTIHSSVLYTLGWVNKVYRSKEATAIYSNKREVQRMKTLLGKLKDIFGRFTPYDLNEITESVEAFPNFIQMVKDGDYKRWEEIKIPIPTSFKSNFKTPKQLIKAELNCRSFDKIFETELLEDVAYEYRAIDSLTINEIVPLLCDYLDKITTDSVKKHTQTLLYERQLIVQKKLEQKLGENFTVRDFANTLDNWQLEKIQRKWHIDLLNYKGSWSDLTNYLYSPSMIAEIRNELGVKVRSKTKLSNRKGVESSEKKRLEKSIERKLRALGNDYNNEIILNEINSLKKKLEIAQLNYEQAKLNSDEENVEKLRQKYYYVKRCLSKKEEKYSKLLKTHEELKKDEHRYKLIMEMISESRSGEELSAFEEDERIQSIRKQKAEKEIPYYTWRFVCDKMNEETASKIKETLEYNLNKGTGVNGEDGYINVNVFPMNRCFEFFVDYPKNSNLFRAFKKKGIELSNILIEGVAAHLKKSFVSPKGEMFINSPMEKTLSGDMLEWIGL